MLVEVRDEDFTPDGLRDHAETAEFIADVFEAERANVRGNPEHAAILYDLVEDCRRFVAVFRGMADRLAEVERLRADAARLDAAEKAQWEIAPQCGGGWVVTASHEDYEIELARTRGTIRDAIDGAREVGR